MQPAYRILLSRIPTLLRGRGASEVAFVWSTNIAALRLERALSFTAPPTAEASPGAIALAVGQAPGVEASVRFGIVNFVGPEWRSRWGGRIERRILLDTRLESSEEGGPVVDGTGALLGISTFGPRDRV